MTLRVLPKILRATRGAASAGKNAERHAQPQPPFCINRPADCIFRRVGCFLPTGTPGGGVQIPEFSASRSPRVRERAHNTALKVLILNSNASRAARFSTGCGPLRLPFAQNPVCKRPRMLNIPKNARRTLPQALAARRRIASASPVTAGGPRACIPNLSAGRKDPAARSARRGPDMSEDDLGGKPWGLRWGRFQPRLFVAEADAQRLGLAHQIALGVDIFELAGDLLERHVAHLAVA